MTEPHVNLSEEDSAAPREDAEGAREIGERSRRFEEAAAYVLEVSGELNRRLA